VRFEPALSIAAAALWLPPARETAEDAIAAGRLDPDTAAAKGYLAVPVSEELAAPELAVLAADQALATAGWQASTIDLVVHAWTYYQGHDFWSAPHFVAHRVGAVHAVTVGVQQMCNGGAAAVEVAATRLLADPAVARALVTTADRFAPPAFDRWGGDHGAVYGDGATALLLAGPELGPQAGPEAAPLRLLATASSSAPQLERMYRGDDPFGLAPRTVTDRVDTTRTVRQFRGDRPQLDDLVTEAMHTVVSRALTEARLDGDDARLRFVAPPRLAHRVVDVSYRAVVAAHTSAALLRLGRDTGHLGAGDAAANLADIHAGGLLTPGEIAILLSVGAGFTWSALVVQAACPPGGTS
jgi:3-oxoacyl-[acyl-carrier-protein] synthase III